MERIIALNGFGCPVSSLTSHAEIRGRHPPLAKNTTDQKEYHSCGIWVQASYINHNCISNAHRAFIGNMMIVRASRDMDAGTEITFWYHNPEGGSAKKAHERYNQWGFTCGCVICLDDRAINTLVHRKRHKLLEDLKRVFNSPSLRRHETRQIERLLDTLNQTYTQPAKDVPRFLVCDPQLALARVYLAQNKAEKILESAVKVLTSRGFVVVGADSSLHTRFAVVEWGLLVDFLVETFLHVRTAFTAMGAVENAKRADEYARTAYKILVGEGESFDTTFTCE